MVFYNRETELRVLDRLWESPNAEFLVLYGRRRIGKTELLGRFASTRRCIYLEATDVRAEDQLRDFGDAYAQGLDLGVVVAVESWEQALSTIEQATRSGRTVVVLDEFQYLVKQTPGVSSILSRWWRETGRSLDLVLVLSGSDIAFFAEDVLGANAPLHGRRTADIQLHPFVPRDAQLFYEPWSSEDKVRAYAVWGGVPYYLHFLAQQKTLAENLFETILMPGAPLANEAEYLIRMESRLRDVSLYGSVLRAIAAGRTGVTEIANHISVDAGNLSRQLDRLAAIGLVADTRPVLKGRRNDVSWRIADPFLRFWFRFVAPAGAQLATEERAHRYLEQTVLPNFDEFVSYPSFEEICQEHLLSATDAATVGRWWGPITERMREDGGLRTVEREADAVAVDDSGHVIALGTCKWTNSPVDISEINKLRRIAAHLEPDGRQIQLYAYQRSGIDERIAQEGVVVVDVNDLFRA